jgi:pyridoxal 5'-phosphate synthase glutaminase subunit Pdx2
MSDPDMIDGIQAAVSIPVMAKARIGHFVEAQVLQAIGVDYVDESEVLTPADYAHHIDKRAFTVPFVCGATNLGEALRRIAEGAAMIRTKGEAGTGDVSQATTHIRTILGEIKRLTVMDETELFEAAKLMSAPVELVRETAELGRLPVVLFTAGGVATPADAAMMMQLGADGVFIGSGIFKSGDPARGPRLRRGDRLLRRRRAHRQGQPRARRGDGRHLRRLPRRRGAAGPARLVTSRRPRIGVLALQGDVREHVWALSAVGADARPVRRIGDLDDVDGLVLPGGESTAIGRLLQVFDLLEPLRAAVHGGLPVYGSCAGMVLLAADLVDGRPDQPVVGGLDVSVRRNAFGSQVESFEADLPLEGVGDEPVHGVFIRRPWVERAGESVQVLARVPRVPRPRVRSSPCGRGRSWRRRSTPS